MILDSIVKNIVGHYIHITWDEAPSETSYFNIYSSEQEVITNDWNALGTTTNNYFSDYTNFDRSILNRRISYKVDALDDTDTVIDTFYFTSDKDDQELLSRTLRVLSRDAEIALRNNQFSEEAFILKPRKSGTFCDCYSQELRASAKPTCTTCYGKGYVGGFYTPMHSYVIVLTENIKRKTINETKPTSYDVVTAVMPSFPMVVEDDYIYVKNVGIFHVTNSTTRSVLGSHTPTTRVTMSLLQPDSVLYEYPLSEATTEVTSVTQDGSDPSKFIITGTNLVPYFGEFKVIISHESNLSEYGVYLFDSITHVTDTEIKITTDETDVLSSFKYRLRLNGMVFEGTTS